MTQRKRAAFLVLTVLVTFSLVLTACGGSASASKATEGASVKWIAYSTYPATNHHNLIMAKFAEDVKAATNGKVEMTVQAGGALGYKGPELLQVVRDGLVPVSDIFISGTAGDEPLFNLATFPLLYNDLAGLKSLNELAFPYYEKVLAEKWGQKLLYISPWTPQGLWSNKVINTLEDIKGLKTRTSDKTGASIMQAVGAVPYPLPFGELYTALATNVIDSVMTSTPTAVDVKMWEVLKHYSPLYFSVGTNMVTVSLKEFNKLDKATQDAMMKVATDLRAHIFEDSAPIDAATMKVCTDNGIIVDPVSPALREELYKATESVREEIFKNSPPEVKEIVDKWLAANKK